MNTLKYPLVCFDLDGTLVDNTIYIWTTLHEGIKTNLVARQQAHNDFFEKKISYKQWFENDLKLLKEAGGTKEKFVKLLNGLKPMQGAKETLQTLKRRGHKIAIISGSLNIVVEHLFSDITFDHILINKIFFSENGLITGGIPTKYDIEGKSDGLLELCKRENINPNNVAFIGDNINDIHIAKTAGFSIAFNCKSEKLSKICDIEILSKNVNDILTHIK